VPGADQNQRTEPRSVRVTPRRRVTFGCAVLWVGAIRGALRAPYYDALSERREDDAVRPVNVLSTAALHPGLRWRDLQYFSWEAPRLQTWLQTRPCLVHHDLPWTPARVTQRWGRVVRAGSNFAAVAETDIYVPILDLEADRRLFDTVKARAAIGDLLLPRQVLEDVRDDDEYALPDELLDQLRP